MSSSPSAATRSDSRIHWHEHKSSLSGEENKGATSETRTHDPWVTSRARYHCATPAAPSALKTTRRATTQRRQHPPSRVVVAVGGHALGKPHEVVREPAAHPHVARMRVRVVGARRRHDHDDRGHVAMLDGDAPTTGMREIVNE